MTLRTGKTLSDPQPSSSKSQAKEPEPSIRSFQRSEVSSSLLQRGNNLSFLCCLFWENLEMPGKAFGSVGPVINRLIKRKEVLFQLLGQLRPFSRLAQPEQPDQGLTDLSTLGSRAGPLLGRVT